MTQSAGTPAPDLIRGSRRGPIRFRLGKRSSAGPVELQVHDVLVGPEAIAAVLAASPTNVEPRDGTTYVAVNLSARNVGEHPLWLDNDDFALTGNSGSRLPLSGRAAARLRR